MKITDNGLPEGATLAELQRYIEREARKRGFGNQRVLAKCLIYYYAK